MRMEVCSQASPFVQFGRKHRSRFSRSPPARPPAPGVGAGTRSPRPRGPRAVKRICRQTAVTGNVPLRRPLRPTRFALEASHLNETGLSNAFRPANPAMESAVTRGANTGLPSHQESGSGQSAGPTPAVLSRAASQDKQARHRGRDPHPARRAVAPGVGRLGCERRPAPGCRRLPSLPAADRWVGVRRPIPPGRQKSPVRRKGQHRAWFLRKVRWPGGRRQPRVHVPTLVPREATRRPENCGMCIRFPTARQEREMCGREPTARTCVGST